MDRVKKALPEAEHSAIEKVREDLTDSCRSDQIEMVSDFFELNAEAERTARKGHQFLELLVTLQPNIAAFAQSFVEHVEKLSIALIRKICAQDSELSFEEFESLFQRRDAKAYHI